MKPSRNTIIRLVSLLAAIIFSAIILLMLLNIPAGNGGYATPIGFDISVMFLVSVLLLTIPLLYDTFRSTHVRFFAFAVALALVLYAAYILWYVSANHIEHELLKESYINNSIFLIGTAALLTLFSTVWRRYTHFFFTCVSVVLIGISVLFTYAFSIGTSGLESLQHINWSEWPIILGTLFLLYWTFIRSLSVSVFK